MTFNQVITDWKFWSVVIALFALVLSQLPPIHILIRKAKLDLEVYSRVFITHKVGNPNLQIHLILRNIGGRVIRVRRMNANISRDSKSIMQLPAQTYVANPKDNQLVLLTSFDLKPETEWSHLVSFLNYFDRDEEKSYREAEINLKNEILRQRGEFGDKHFAVAPHEIVEPFINLFDKNFKWLSGEYLLDISIETDTPEANISKKYRFTIFESQTASLIEHKKGYPSGAAIYWESPAHVGQWIEVEEKNG
jgi:hypothetical protein